MQPYYGDMSIKIPFMRKDTSSTLLVLSTAMALVLLASTLLPLSNFLLQPVQAQTTMTFRTPKPADGTLPCCPLMETATLTFDVQGTVSSSDPQTAKITGGTIQYQEPPNSGNISKGKILEGTFTNDSRHGPFLSFTAEFQNWGFTVQTLCSTSEFNVINIVGYDPGSSTLNGPVECTSSSSQGRNSTTTTAQPSPMTGTTTTTQNDSDGDGIPDSSDRCDHNSHHRCFKEGDTSSTTSSSSTTQQEQQPSSSGNGNQTG